MRKSDPGRSAPAAERAGESTGAMPRVRLLGRSQPAAEPRLDAAQSQAARLVEAGGNLAVVGAPGTGKTTLAISLVVRALGRGLGDQVLLLGATRRAAGLLRERVAAASLATLGQPVVRTPSGLAFSILRRRAVARGKVPPRMVTGPDQDAILAALLAGHQAGEGVPIEWPDSIPPMALGLRALRSELRDLFMRSAERGLDPVGLAELGGRQGRPEWVAAAQLYQEYVDVLALRGEVPTVGALLDAAGVIDEAARCLEAWDDQVSPANRPRWRLVVIDDYQEATAATARLVKILAADGAQIVLLGCPDIAVQGYRGALPGLLAEACDPAPVGFDADLVRLDISWRQPEALRQVTRAVTGMIRPGLLGSGVRNTRPPDLDDGAVGEGSAAGGCSAPGDRNTSGHAGANEGGGAGRDRSSVGDGCAKGESSANGGGEAVGGSAVRSLGRPPDTPVTCVVAGSAAQEAAWAAYQLRTAHVLEGVQWDRMAVIARTGARVGLLRAALAQASVPVVVPASERPLRDEPAVRPLLDALRWATQDIGQHDAAVAVALLTSPLGGFDAIGLRRLRRGLRALERARGRDAASDALIVEALEESACLDALPLKLARPAAHLADSLAAGRRAATAPGNDAHAVLWAIWDASGLSDRWRRLALAGGAAGERADRDLDTVVALFATVERYVDRVPGASPAAFEDYLEAQDIPGDILAPAAPGDGRVTVCTAAGAAGGEWDLVVVTGIQEGTWPDLRLRDTVLGAAQLASVVDNPGGIEDLRERRRAIMDDEARSFALAVSRARRRLILTAVQGGEEQPSAFFDLVDGVGASAESPTPGSADWQPGLDRFDGRRRDVPPPADLRGLVADLRYQLVLAQASARDNGPGEVRPQARLLAALGYLGVDGTDPSTWPGLVADSTVDRLFDLDEIVVLSPSKIESLSTCPLRWALESAGGRPSAGAQQTLGSLIHELAAEFPQGGLIDLTAELTARWPELGLPGGWSNRNLFSRAIEMIERLAAYNASHSQCLAVEVPVEADLGSVRLVGRIDRLELVDGGPGASYPPSLRIVDFKTGRTVPSLGQAQANPQLAAYQVAIDAGGLGYEASAAGADLVYLANGAAEATIRTQTALADHEDPNWASTMIETCRQTATQATFPAVVNRLCDHCPVRACCPAHDVGEQVTA